MNWVIGQMFEECYVLIDVMSLSEASEDARWAELQGVRGVLIGVQSPSKPAAKN